MAVELSDQLADDALLKIMSIHGLCPGLRAAFTYPGWSNHLFLEGATQSDTRVICCKFPEFAEVAVSFLPMTFDAIVAHFCNQTRALRVPFGKLVRLATPQFEYDPAQVLEVNLAQAAVHVRL
jgi:hypothetical protein